jgi:hypothetical protein
MSIFLGWGKGTITEFNTFNDSVKSALGIPTGDGKTIEYSEAIIHPDIEITDVIWAVEDNCPVELRPGTIYTNDAVKTLGYLAEP